MVEGTSGNVGGIGVVARRAAAAGALLFGLLFTVDAAAAGPARRAPPQPTPTCPQGHKTSLQRHDVTGFPATFCRLGAVRNGPAWAHHYNGVLARLERWVDGVRHGPVRQWHEDGTPALQGRYRDGVPHGRWQQWSSRGQLIADFAMRNGTGMFMVAWDKGGLKQRGPMDAGKRTGTWARWRSSGKLEWIGGFRNGDRDGVWQLFNRVGKPNGTIVYDRGSGLEVHWHEDGRRAAYGNVRKGRKHGLWTWWHEDGHRSLQMTFADGAAHGPAMAWHRNGVVASREHFADGRRHGQSRRWDAAGDLTEEGRWERGRPHLLRLSYRRGERLAFVACYAAGRLQWTADRFDLLGKPAANRRARVSRAAERSLAVRARKLPCPLSEKTDAGLPEEVRRAIAASAPEAAPTSSR